MSQRLFLFMFAVVFLTTFTDSSDLKVRKEVCSKPLDKGHDCDLPSKQYFGYDKDANNCTAFYYQSCGGNANRFLTYFLCMRYCHLDACAQAPDVGYRCKFKPGADYNQRQKIKRRLLFSYNRATGSCDKLFYLGCGGNLNKFASKHGCEAFCSK